MDFTIGNDEMNFQGSHQLSDLSFTQQGSNVLGDSGTEAAVVNHTTVADLEHAGNFIFS